MRYPVATITLLLNLFNSVNPVFGAGPAAQPTAPVNPGIEALANLEYKREVLMYCGISDTEAVRGFLDHQIQLIEVHELSREMTLDAASQARQAAYAEWQNRGLGGFRGWCRDEGGDYAAILRSYVIDSQPDLRTNEQGLSQ